MIDLASETLAPGWRELVAEFFATEAGQKLVAFVRAREAAGAHIFPPRPLRMFELTPADAVKVVVIGQDPYHGAGQAQGLAFSVPAGVRMPPSLRNIFAEIERDLGCRPPEDALLRWAAQGVLLANIVLTVEEGQPGSHAGKGWEALISAVLQRLLADRRPKVFMLWGLAAQKRCPAINEPHLMLCANHPSPLSARRAPQPFIGCGHFSRANAFLAATGQTPICWC